MSNTAANETLDAMCNVCGVHCATWVGEDEHGDRHYTLVACDDSGEQFIVHSCELMEAVCELVTELRARSRIRAGDSHA